MFILEVNDESICEPRMTKITKIDKNGKQTEVFVNSTRFYIKINNDKYSIISYNKGNDTNHDGQRILI